MQHGKKLILNTMYGLCCVAFHQLFNIHNGFFSYWIWYSQEFHRLFQRERAYLLAFFICYSTRWSNTVICKCWHEPGLLKLWWHLLNFCLLKTITCVVVFRELNWLAFLLMWMFVFQRCNNNNVLFSELCSLSQSSKVLLILRVTWAVWFELPTLRSASVQEANTMIWMTLAKMSIIIPSLRCWEIGHLETILRFVTWLTYALSLPLKHGPYTTCLLQLFFAAIFIFLQLYLKPAIHISFFRSLFLIFLFLYDDSITKQALQWTPQDAGLVMLPLHLLSVSP